MAQLSDYEPILFGDTCFVSQENSFGQVQKISGGEAVPDRFFKAIVRLKESFIRAAVKGNPDIKRHAEKKKAVTDGNESKETDELKILQDIESEEVNVDTSEVEVAADDLQNETVDEPTSNAIPNKNRVFL